MDVNENMGHPRTSGPVARRLATGALASLALTLSGATLATTDILSANGHRWDVHDGTSNDTGAISDGGQDAFDGWGSLRLRVMDQGGAIITSDQELSGFGLAHDGGRRFETTTPVVVDGVSTTRSLYAPDSTDYMRYLDTFTNTTGSVLQISVAWGGNLGSDSSTTVSATSSGDLSITAADTWASTIENSASNPAGPATDPAISYVFQNISGVGHYSSTPFDTAWPGNGNDSLAFVYGPLTLNPGESVTLANFLYRSLEEGGATGPLGQQPADGSQIALVNAEAAALSSSPDLGDLPAGVTDNIVNWNLSSPPPPPAPRSSATPVPTLPAYGLALTILGLLLVAGRRLKAHSGSQ